MLVKKEVKKGKGKNGLTKKQREFTKEYLKTGNGTQAAKKAYKVSDKVASVMAVENLGKPSIKAEIQSAAEKLGISNEYVLNGIKEIAEFNKQKQTKFITVGDNTFEENKMIDPQAALKAHDLLGKHLKLFTDQIEIKAEVKTEDQELTDTVRQLLFLATQS